MLKLEKNSKILVLAAHPDDETLGCGGTIKHLSDKGYNVELLTFTDGVGSRNKKDKNRNEKLDEVSKILGISNYTFFDFPDMKLDSIPHFSFDYNNRIELLTYFNQEMLKKGFLAKQFVSITINSSNILKFIQKIISGFK